MLYKFKSKNTGDVIMLPGHGKHLLEIIGKETQDGAAGQGIILFEQIPAALMALQAAIVDEESARDAAVAEALAKGEPIPQFSEVSLRQRAQPFIEMLQRCQDTGDAVVWGV